MSRKVPEGWRDAKLGDVCGIRIGGTPPRGEPSYWAAPEENGYPWASISDLSQGYISSTKERITPAGVENSNVKPVKSGTILMSFKLTIGRVGVAGCDLYTNEAIAAFDEDQRVIDRGYLKYVLPMAAGAGDVDEAVKGKTLNKRKLAQLKLLLPPLPEQRGIAEILSSVEEAIAATQAVIEQKSRLRERLLRTLFHRGNWEQEKPLPSGWTLRRLDDVAVRGSGHTPNKKKPEYWNGGIKWVSLRDTKRLDHLFIDSTEAEISDVGMANSSAVLHPSGTVVLSRDATVGRSAIMTMPMAVSQHFIAWRCEYSLNNMYLYYWLQSMKPVFERIGAGSTIKTIGLPFFRRLEIPVPPLREQDNISEKMRALDEAMFAEFEALDRLKVVRSAVTSDLLTGRKRVPMNELAAAE
ncbi:restriction endonuclease subunit S [Caenispirillum salinarum]|uniref:restriction endonuclease subunit S n=1 Tax=Caenispirillum salinarum TaxID=859058 RepID=UPI00384C4BF9